MSKFIGKNLIAAELIKTPEACKYTEEDIQNTYNSGYSQGKADGIRDMKDMQDRLYSPLPGTNLKRKATATVSPYKGKYGVEYVAACVYDLKYSPKYNDDREREYLYSSKVFACIAKTQKRAIKKLEKKIKQYDLEIIQAEKERQ